MKTKLLLFLFFLTGVLNAQNTPTTGNSSKNFIEIGEILKNPSNFNNEFVTTEGLVIQYTQGDERTTSFYLLKSDYGAILKVNTAQGQPETNAKYEVSGTVVIDLVNRTVFLVEQSKIKRTNSDIKIVTSPVNWMLIIAIGGLVLLIVLLIIYLVVKNRSEKRESNIAAMTRPSDINASPISVSPSNDNQDFKTIRITQSSPKTLKMIPGRLQIISGLDKGKEFPIMGFPGSDGSVLTIGREKGNSQSEFSYIQLLEKTVSRKQAEILYVDQKLYVKNYSETNLTQLNGVDLKFGERAEITINSIIKTGEVEFKYIL